MKSFFMFLIAAITGATAWAQDIHFSQYFNAPLTLNPALTGFTPGTYRLGVNYRNQWFTTAGGDFGKSPYMTTAAAFDMPVKIKNDILGVGLYLDNDQAGANTFSQVTLCVSVAYIKTMGKKANHRLAAGFQAGVTSTSVNITNFQWASQFEDNVFNATLPANEPLNKTNYAYANLNAGLFWYGKISDVLGIYAGASLFNISTPKIDIVAGDDQRLYMRWSMHGGLDIKVAKKYHILPAVMFMNQVTNNELNSGLGWGIDFAPDITLTLGLYNRINTFGGGAAADAVIPYAAMNYKGFGFGVSYDVTVSQWKYAGSAVGALEFSLSYTGKPKNYNYKSALICPRF